ncbi:hypothetical protein IU433_22240 [Nocardia puris]|uniref:hypothetical protein n=1 Tax=Nocardia TaxID=1817 RepID=UPI000691F7EE|nr:MULTISPECIES: hypothetical protein [Nocardia]MBF6137239.1 hypothetical protein [Nocardia otitidiscaviarum]MBF6181843.1 hypothetical protein [Nocardia otitidiscaviarum]MBF6216268.1 hypothetical protein [Nocardia puris]MBF6461736.1 hypothetical protein [Nocardia puris]MBF6488136.1 hypothetical protein [Nocardia otitidiscaviarum]
MGLIWIAAVAVLAALLLWWAFPTLARIVGFFIVFDSLLALVLTPARAIPGRLGWLALGLVIWLAGHWAYAFKHGAWASPIALRIFALPGLRWMIPRCTLIHFDDRYR